MLWTRNFIAMNTEAANQLPSDKLRSLHSILILPTHQDNSSHTDLQQQFCIHVRHKMCQIQTICSLTWRIQGDHFGGYAPTQHLDHQLSPFQGSWQWLRPQTWGMSAERLSRRQPSGLPADMGTWFTQVHGAKDWKFDISSWLRADLTKGCHVMLIPTKARNHLKTTTSL